MRPSTVLADEVVTSRPRVTCRRFIVALLPVRYDVDGRHRDRKSTRLNSSHGYISYAVFCLKKKKKRAAPSGPGLLGLNRWTRRRNGGSIHGRRVPPAARRQTTSPSAGTGSSRLCDLSRRRG